MGNRSFETAGATTGAAQDWTTAVSAGGLQWAIFNGAYLHGLEAFERGFSSNEDSIFDYEASDLAWALFLGLSWEHFEKGFSVEDILGNDPDEQVHQVLTGKTKASICTTGSPAPPWTMVIGDLLTYKVDGGIEKSFKVIDKMFKTPAAVYPWEMAQVLRDNLGGVDVYTDGVELILSSPTAGSTSTLQITGGAVAAAMGLPLIAATGVGQNLLWPDGHIGILTTTWDTDREDWAADAEDFMTGWRLPGFDHNWTHDVYAAYWDSTEEEWRYLAGDLAWATFDGADVDAFESGWRDNENCIWSYPAGPGVLDWAGFGNPVKLLSITGSTGTLVNALDTYQYSPKLWLIVDTVPTGDVALDVEVTDDQGNTGITIQVLIAASLSPGATVDFDLQSASPSPIDGVKAISTNINLGAGPTDGVYSIYAKTGAYEDSNSSEWVAL